MIRQTIAFVVDTDAEGKGNKRDSNGQEQTALNHYAVFSFLARCGLELKRIGRVFQEVSRSKDLVCGILD